MGSASMSAGSDVPCPADEPGNELGYVVAIEDGDVSASCHAQI